MKKLLLLLLLSVLAFGSVNEVLASTIGGGGDSFDITNYNCDCGNDWSSYYKCNEKIYYNCILIHEFDSSGNVFDRHFSYPKCTPDDLCYWVMRVQSSSDGTKEIVPTRIIISADTVIDLYDDDSGLTYRYSYDDYSSICKGNYNDKYYFIDSNYSLMTINEPTDNSYKVVWSGDWQYIVESDDSYNDIVDLAVYLCGGDNVTLPDSVTSVAPLPSYDLEPPLDVKVTTVELDLFTNIPYKIWWNQSNINLTGYNTVFYVKGYGDYKPSVFSAFKDIETSWMFEESLVTAKYCNNNLKYFDYSYEDMEKDLRAIAENIEGDSIYQIKNNSVDFMIRNEKEDGNGQMHYSNWVYVNTYEDGTYSVFEMNKDYSLDEDSDETGQINTDSTIYDDELIYEDNEETLDVGGVSNVGSFIKVMKDLANSLKTFPEFFAKMFSFLPSWVLTCIGILFIIILICAIF